MRRLLIALLVVAAGAVWWRSATVRVLDVDGTLLLCATGHESILVVDSRLVLKEMGECRVLDLGHKGGRH